MKKYILEGGNYLKYPEKVKAFFSEALKGLGNEPTILWCLFASEVTDRHERYKKYTSETTNYAFPAGVQPKHLEANEEDFVEQVARADFINIQGGSTIVLKTALEAYDLEKLFEGKVVGGHSAGAHVFADTYWSPGFREFGNGFGVLSIKTLTHFKSDFGSDDPRGPIDWEAAHEELKNYGDPDLPIYALEEGEFVVLKV